MGGQSVAPLRLGDRGRSMQSTQFAEHSALQASVRGPAVCLCLLLLPSFWGFIHCLNGWLDWRLDLVGEWGLHSCAGWALRCCIVRVSRSVGQPVITCSVLVHFLLFIRTYPIFSPIRNVDESHGRRKCLPLKQR